jgi:hypothetical protein
MIVLAHLNHAQLALGQIDKLDLFYSDSFTSAPVESFVDGTESSFAQTFS